jgi:pimeloyl-ACP methyl ester carboxylesterase
MTTLLLSGWTQPTDALAPLADDAVLFDYSDYASPDAAIEALRKLKPRHAVAWSLGGQLALRAIAAGALAPKHLTVIAAPVQFVSSGSDLEGMGAETYRLFKESYMHDPARTKSRFHGLIAKGDGAFKQVMGLLGYHPQVEDIGRWLPWLEDLAHYRLDMVGLASAPPTLIIHGMNDVIVPHAQSEYLARHLPRAQLNSWAQVGHAPHAHDAVRLRREMHEHRALQGVA